MDEWQLDRQTQHYESWVNFIAYKERILWNAHVRISGVDMEESELFALENY